MASPATIGGVQVLLPDQGDTYAWGSAVKNALTQLAFVSQQGVCAIYRVTTPPTFPSNVFTKMNFNALVEDTDNAVTTGVNWTFTVPAGKGGDYLMGVEVNCGATAVGPVTRWLVSVFKASTEIGRLFDTGDANFHQNQTASGLLMDALVPGDQISFQMFPGGGTSLGVDTSGNLSKCFIKRIL